MTFPSIVDREMDSSNVLFLAFSSPVIALMDAVDVVIDLSTQLILGATLHDATRKTLWRRARQRYEKDIKVIEPTYLEKSTVLRLVIAFVLLSQGLQIFTFKNLLWAKLLASMYLSSYFTLLLLLYLAPKDWRSTPPLEEVTSRYSASWWIPFQDVTRDGVYFCAAGLQLVLYFFLFDKIVHSTLEIYVPSDSRTPWKKGDQQPRFDSIALTLFAAIPDFFLALLFWLVMLLLPIFCCTFAVLITVRLYQALKAKDIGVGLCHLGLLLLFTPSLAYCSYEMFHIQANFEAFADVADYAMVISAVYICMGVLYICSVGGIIKAMQMICERSESLKGYRPEGPGGVLLLVFATVNFGMLFWFFVYGYDFAP